MWHPALQVNLQLKRDALSPLAGEVHLCHVSQRCAVRLQSEGAQQSGLGTYQLSGAVHHTQGRSVSGQPQRVQGLGHGS